MILILAQQHDEAYELEVWDGVLKTRVIVTSKWKAVDWKVRDWQRDMGQRWQAWLGIRERAGSEGKGWGCGCPIYGEWTTHGVKGVGGAFNWVKYRNQHQRN